MLPVLNTALRSPAVTYKRLISTQNITFNFPTTLSSNPEAREDMKAVIALYSERCGADKGGAYTAGVRASWHSGSLSHGDTYKRTTVTFINEAGQRLFWYRKSDQSYWDSIHVPANIPENREIWEVQDDYVPATEEQWKAWVDFNPFREDSNNHE